MRAILSNIAGDKRGTSAIEFAILGPVFILLLVGIFFLCMGLAVAGSMHFAVEEGARCASVRTMVCADNDTTITYTKNHYYGPSSMPNFSYDAAAACGHSVSASMNYTVDLGLKQITIPITAAACFP